jgi:Amt family ammonium transporter
VYAAIGTFVIIKLIDLVMGIRLAKDDELQGVDIINHEESAYTNK